MINYDKLKDGDFRRRETKEDRLETGTDGVKKRRATRSKETSKLTSVMNP